MRCLQGFPRWTSLLVLFAFCGGLTSRCALAQTEAGADRAEIPDATLPMNSATMPAAPSPQNQSPQGQDTASPGTNATSSEPAPSTPPQSQQQTAQQQLKQEEKQRILGVVPNFATTDIQNAAPLTAKQKFQLDLKSSLDPFEFVFAGLDAADEQAEDTFPSYGQGVEGYAKRFGASYADTFDGGLWGNAILPAMLHEDPRYFRKGSGPFMNRFLYAAWTTIWCKRDNGTWGPNYANVGGNFIAGGISNLYYPQAQRGAELTVTRALTVTAEGAIGAEFVEFWPDVSRRLFSKRAQKKPNPAPSSSTPAGPPPNNYPQQ